MHIVRNRKLASSMDEARAVLARLDRIETLEREGAPPGVLLDELRGLVRGGGLGETEGGERAQRMNVAMRPSAHPLRRVGAWASRTGTR